MSAARGGSGSLVIGGAALLGIALLIGLALGGRDPRLSTGPTGFEGLRHWMVAQGLPARSFGGGYPLDASALGLRILPLYDTDPDTRRPRPETQDDVLALSSERDISWSAIQGKTSITPTLIVLPKWRRGMRLTRRAHPDFLIPDDELDAVVAGLMGPATRLATRRGAGFEEVPLSFDGATFEAALYAPRAAIAPSCLPVIGTESRAFLLECPALVEGTYPVWVLTDPDLLNTHGLALGENAGLAAALLATLANSASGIKGDGGETIVIDYSDSLWTRRGGSAVDSPRSWAEAAAFFAWPYMVIWLGLGAVLLLALWRGAVRGAPAQSIEQPAPLAPIEAEARLLVLSGDGGRLLADYADQRLSSLTHRLLGPRAGVTQLMNALPRRAPLAGPPLLRTAAEMRKLPASLSGEAALARVHDLETLIAQVIDEFD